jgi:hypothetical protein
VGAGAAQLFTFANSTARDKWLTLGATIGPVVVGPNWAIVAPSDASADQIASTTGGVAY